MQDRYIIEGLLGKGGYGSVYKVRDLRVRGNLYALKETHSPNKRDRQRFSFEADLLKRLDHPSLPRVYRVFDNETHERTYMLMDYIDGPNLESVRQQQDEQRFSLSQTLTMLGPVVSALHYLHSQQPAVIHRDIKPSNIIIPHSGDAAVLVDFGIAKEFDPDSTTTALRTGSPGYAAPEQYTRGTTTRTDIYSLGATFYTLLTGKIPLDALYRITHISAGQPDPLEPVQQFDPMISPQVADAIQRALSLNSNERFASIEEFWQAFQAHPMWRPLDAPGALPFSLNMPSPSSTRAMNTPLPPVIRVRKQGRAALPRLLLLLFLLVFLISSVLAGLFWYKETHIVATSPAPTTRVGTGVTAIITQRVTPTSAPTKAPSTPKSTPTVAHQPVGGVTPTVMTTPPPTPTHAPPPPPTPSPTPIPYPNVAGNYSGTIDDTTANIITGMALSIQQKSGQGAIAGYFTVNPPLTGNGNFSGSVTTGKYVQFVVQAYKNNSPLYFWGWLQGDGSLQGDYCSLNKQHQCDPNAGASGTWNVAKG